MGNKKNNPLYHVSKDGKDVESVDNVVELLIKKLGLDPVISMLESFIQFMADQVKTYAMFTAIKDLYDELLEKLMELYSRVRPLLAF
jgi:hypothetical protein